MLAASYTEPSDRARARQWWDYSGYINNATQPHSHHHHRHGMDGNGLYEDEWRIPSSDYRENKDPNKKWPDDLHQGYEASTTMSEGDDSEGNPKTLKRVFTRFGERTSMQGIPYINASKTWYAKLAWVLLSLFAIGAMSYHLFYLFSSFYSHVSQSKVTLGFDNLRFPSVTLCNVNPVKNNKLSLGSKELKEYVKSIRPDRMVNSLAEKNPNQPRPTQPGSTTKATNNNEATSSTRANQGSTRLPNKDSNSTRSTRAPSTGAPSPGRRRRFIEDLTFNFTNKRREYENIFEHRKRPSTHKSNFLEIREEFTSLFSAIDRDTRIEMGHQLNDMIISCSFSGYVCNTSSIRLFTTSTYGNCFTLDDSNFVSYKSGPSNGLELMLFLEADEYISTIASGNGAQLQIHGPNTWPDPEVDGLAIAAGTETSIAMRMVHIERLGDPWGKCDDGKAFAERYGMVYTRQTCHKFCLQEEIVKKCKCFDEEKEEMNEAINEDTSVASCETEAEMRCMMRIEANFEVNATSCSCLNPCSETMYQRLTSSRQWPNDAYANMLVQHLCNTMNETECERFEKMDRRNVKENFLKLNIYFEDLNYENITEIPDYEEAQFLSDVGGTIGLWIGLSMLSLAEVFQFVAELFHYLCCVRPKRGKKRHPRRHGRDNQLDMKRYGGDNADRNQPYI